MSSCFGPLEDLVGEEDQESKEWFERYIEEYEGKLELDEMAPSREEVLQR